MKFRRNSWAVPVALALTCTAGFAADAGDAFLSPEKAFAYVVEADGDCLKVYWNAAPGYYLYKSRMSLDSATPEVTARSGRLSEGRKPPR